MRLGAQRNRHQDRGELGADEVGRDVGRDRGVDLAASLRLTKPLLVRVARLVRDRVDARGGHGTESPRSGAALGEQAAGRPAGGLGHEVHQVAKHLREGSIRPEQLDEGADHSRTLVLGAMQKRLSRRLQWRRHAQTARGIIHAQARDFAALIERGERFSPYRMKW
jgi:hypothetical protein